MRQILAFLCCALTVLFPLIAVAQTANNDLVKIPLNAVPGSRAQVVYTAVKTQGGKENIGKLTASLEVKSIIDNGYIMAWTTDIVEIAGEKYDKTSSLAGSLLLGVPFVFTTDWDGAPVRVHDIQKTLEDLRNNEILAQFDPKIVNAVIEYMKNTPDDALAKQFFEVPTVMSLCQNTELKLGEEETWEGSVPFPVPNQKGELKTVETFRLVSVDKARQQARIRYTRKFDKDDLNEFIAKYVTELFGEIAKKPIDMDGKTIENTTQANCVVNMGTGWVETMQYELRLNDGKKIGVNMYDIKVTWQ